jgi:hypothetical protein
LRKELQEQKFKMKGTLHKPKDKWVVRYWDIDPYHKGSPGDIKQIVQELEVSPISLSNPTLSTYWVEGREVKFGVDFFTDPNQVIISSDEEYKIVINSVSDFRYELIKMIEKVRYNIDGYNKLTSSQIAEIFEKKINYE